MSEAEAASADIRPRDLLTPEQVKRAAMLLGSLASLDAALEDIKQNQSTEPDSITLWTISPDSASPVWARIAWPLLRSTVADIVKQTRETVVKELVSLGVKAG